jgi:hypothetical protein
MIHKPNQPVIQTIAEKSTNLFTLSKLYVNGEFICYILEDPIRVNKIMHQTAIPAGYYKINLITWGRHHDTYKHKYKLQHKGIFQLQQVQGFVGINIHIGNSTKDTSGCLLPGMSFSMLSNGDCVVNRSTEAYFKLYTLFLELLFNHKFLFIYHRCKVDYPLTD